MSTHPPPTALVIVAAGAGKRMGGDVPKPFIPLRGRMVIEWTLGAFGSVDWITRRIVVLASSEFEESSPLRLRNRELESVLRSAGATDLVPGGLERTQSVLNGVLCASDAALVLVHDAVRPFAAPALALRVAMAALKHGCAVPGIPVKDTIKEVDRENIVTSTPSRAALRAIQTPQGFRRETLLAAYRHVGLLDSSNQPSPTGNTAAFTDEAMLVEAFGAPVYVVQGEPENIKLTEPTDLAIADAMLASHTAPTPPRK